MTFEEAEVKLKELAQGSHCGLRKYHYDGANILKGEYPQWSIYLDRYGSHEGKSWEEALEKLEKAMKEEEK